MWGEMDPCRLMGVYGNSLKDVPTNMRYGSTSKIGAGINAKPAVNKFRSASCG